MDEVAELEMGSYLNTCESGRIGKSRSAMIHNYSRQLVNKGALPYPARCAIDPAYANWPNALAIVDPGSGRIRAEQKRRSGRKSGVAGDLG